MAAFHEMHITGNLITYVIVTSKEITKDEYFQIIKKKAEKRKAQGLPVEFNPILETMNEVKPLSSENNKSLIPPIKVGENGMLTNTNLGLIEKTNRTAGVRESHQTTIPNPTLTKEDVNKNRYAVTPINRGNNVGTRDSLNANRQSFR